MTASAANVPNQAPTLDIHVRRDNQWHLHARHPAANKFEAIEEAERLDGQPDFEGVRVMTASGNVEVLVWISPRLAETRGGVRKKPAVPATAAPAGVVRRGAADKASGGTTEGQSMDVDDPVAPSAPTAAARGGTPFYRTKFGALATAIGIGIVAGGAALAMVGDFMRRGFPISMGVAIGFAVLVFVLAAGITVMMMRQQREGSKESMIGDGTIGALAGSASMPSTAGSAYPRTSTNAEPPIAEEAHLALVKFLEGIVVAIKDVAPRLDPNTALGLNLVVAGASEALGDSRNYSPIQTRVLVRQALGVMGATSETVEIFIDALPDHRRNPSANAMIECGRNAMDSYLRGDGLPLRDLPDAFRAWQRSFLNVETGDRILTVMVTTVVGPTTAESTAGALQADMAIRVHDAIVRGVLATSGGHELRHAGDGIMAAFPNPDVAARAALDIQHAITAHNASAGLLPLAVRIGLNANGGPGQQGDSPENTIQDALYACSLVMPGQIGVTGTAVASCQEQDFAFLELTAPAAGDGIPPMPVFELTWRQDSSAEPGSV